MPLNYLQVRNRVRQYQEKPSKVTESRLAAEVLLIQLQSPVRESESESLTSMDEFDWSDGEVGLEWSEMLALLRKDKHSVDTFIGCVIDTLNERDLLPDEGFRSENL